MLVVSEKKVNYTESELAAMTAEERELAEQTMAQYAEVAERLNKETKAKYNTALKILYYTEDEYYDALETKLLNTEKKMDELATAT